MNNLLPTYRSFDSCVLPNLSVACICHSELACANINEKCMLYVKVDSILLNSSQQKLYFLWESHISFLVLRHICSMSRVSGERVFLCTSC